MPVCFQLYLKDNLEAGPVMLADVDVELCQHFHQPVDPDKYLAGWYDSIGLRLALGKSFEQIRVEFEELNNEVGSQGHYGGLIEIVKYLNEHFVPNGFRSMC